MFIRNTEPDGLFDLSGSAVYFFVYLLLKYIEYTIENNSIEFDLVPYDML